MASVCRHRVHQLAAHELSRRWRKAHGQALRPNSPPAWKPVSRHPDPRPQHAARLRMWLPRRRFLWWSREGQCRRPSSGPPRAKDLADTQPDSYDGSRRCAHHRSPTTPRGFLTDAAYHTRRGLSFARRRATRVLWFHHRAMLHPCTRDAPMDGSPWPGRESAPTLLTHPTGDWPSKSESTCSSYAEQACCKSAVGWLHISDPLFPLFQPAATKHRSAGRTCCGIGVGLVRPMFSLVARCGWGVAGRVGALLLVHTGWAAAEAVRILLLAHHWR